MSRFNTYSKLMATLLLACVASIGFSLAAHAQELQLTPTERSLPTFELQDLQNSTWDSSSLEGQPYIVNFWATWCAPCVHELPAMNRAAAQLVGEGVGMLAINVGEDANTIQAFMQQVPIDFDVVLGNQLTLPNWKVRGLPTTFIVSAEGNIIAEAIGPREWDDPKFIEYMLTLRK